MSLSKSFLSSTLAVVAGLSLTASAQAAFIVYDDFNTGASLDPLRWTGSGTVGGGVVTLTNGQSPRSLMAFAPDTTLRIVVNAFAAPTGNDGVGFGSSALAQNDQFYIRSDNLASGATFYTNLGGFSFQTGFPDAGIWDFTAGTTTLTIHKNGGLVASVARPVAFDTNQAFDFFTYGTIANPSSLTIDQVSYSVIPEPTSLALLGCVGLLAVRRRR